MNYTNDGLTLIYDTADAPVPQGDRIPFRNESVTAMLKPLNPSNAVTVRYRVNGGPDRILRAVPGQRDYQNNSQYFHATFPSFPVGQSVDYEVSGSCAGRRVPDISVANDLPLSFRIAGLAHASESQVEHSEDANPSEAEPARYPLLGEFLARATIVMEDPRIVGPTPEGIRVTWNAKTGSVEGPTLSAKLLQSADWMQIRPDGIANVNVRTLLETAEGGTILMTHSGVLELGEDGFTAFQLKNIPKRMRVWTAPLFLTADTKYEWLNRLQCVSVGEVFMDRLTYVYDLYALK